MALRASTVAIHKLYIDDLVTTAEAQGQGYGRAY